MSPRWWTPSIAVSAGLSLLASFAGCQPVATSAIASKTPTPAKVESPAKESDLATIKLTTEAETRLGNTLTPVESKPVARTCTYGGDTNAKNRRAILSKVAANASPAVGILQNVHARIGQKVAAGTLLFDVASLDPIWIKVPVYVAEFGGGK